MSEMVQLQCNVKFADIKLLRKAIESVSKTDPKTVFAEYPNSLLFFKMGRDDNPFLLSFYKYKNSGLYVAESDTDTHYSQETAKSMLNRIAVRYSAIAIEQQLAREGYRVTINDNQDTKILVDAVRYV